MRDKILQLAEEQMKAGGYEHLNFGTIAKALETTRANLHYHFKNKESLALEVTKKFIQESEQDVMKIAFSSEGNFIKFLEAFEKMMEGEIVENKRCRSCVCSQIIREADVPDSLTQLAREHFNKMSASMEEMITVSQQNGILKKDLDPKKLAFRTGIMIMGFGQIGMAFGDDPEKLKYLRGTLTDWIYGFKA